MEDKKNNKFKLFGKIPVFDIIIILVVAAVIIFMMYFLFLTKKDGGEKLINYTISIQKQDLGFEKNIHIGDDIYNSVDDKYFGKIKSISVKDHMETGVNLDTGESILAKQPNCEDIDIAIETKANVSEKIMMDNFRVHVNAEIYIKNPTFSAVGIITDIDRTYLENK